MKKNSDQEQFQQALGKVIRKYRKAAGMTQDQLAEAEAVMQRRLQERKKK